jgi:hypothetical protein
MADSHSIRGSMQRVRELTEFFRQNPQVLILLVICLVLGIGTFIVVLFGVASSGSTTTDGMPSDAIFGLHLLLG